MDYQTLLAQSLRQPRPPSAAMRGSVMLKPEEPPVQINPDLPLESVSPEDWIPNPKSLAMGLAGVVGKGSEKLFAQKVIDSLRGPEFKARSTTVNMPIGAFLDMAEPLARPDERKMAGVKSLLEKGVPFETSPVLYLNDIGRQSKVVGHEGRHRAMALREQGYTHLPVELRGDIRWSQQGRPNFDYRAEWPETLVGQGGSIRPYPLRREQADLPFPEVWD